MLLLKSIVKALPFAEGREKEDKVRTKGNRGPGVGLFQSRGAEERISIYLN